MKNEAPGWYRSETKLEPSLAFKSAEATAPTLGPSSSTSFLGPSSIQFTYCSAALAKSCGIRSAYLEVKEERQKLRGVRNRYRCLLHHCQRASAAKNW